MQSVAQDITANFMKWCWTAGEVLSLKFKEIKGSIVMFFYLTHKQMLYSLIQLRDFTWHSPWALKRNAFLAVPAKKSLTALQTGAMGNTRASSVQTGIKLEWQTLHAGGNLISILLPFKTDILINLLIILFNETGKEWTKTAMQHKTWNYCT